MRRIRTISDINECRNLWKQLIPDELISDLWEVRFCFHDRYNNRPHFIVAENNGQITGFLPLCWNEETEKFNYFPGETWEGKTWLEQNRIIADSRETLDAMLDSLGGSYHLRYIRNEGNWSDGNDPVDEVGYLFLPEPYNYDLNRYFEAFSHKTAKKIKKELAGWEKHKIEWRLDEPEDFGILTRMNLERYGDMSYFGDSRFLESFHALTEFLQQRGWLRVVTVLIDGEPAAVDMGSLYRGMLTMLAGGTNEKFRGIAKLINVFHMTYACENKLDSVDFLCGDFNWKALFHLTPVPLSKLEGESKTVSEKSLSRSCAYTSPFASEQALRGALNV